MRKNHSSLFFGAFLGGALLIGGYSFLSYWECFFLPNLSWCHVPPDPKPKPKQLQPDVPPCGTFVGPCQQ